MGLDQGVEDQVRQDCSMAIRLNHQKCQEPMEQNLEVENCLLLMGGLGTLVLGFLVERVVLEQNQDILLEQESVESAESVELYLEVALYQAESRVEFHQLKLLNMG